MKTAVIYARVSTAKQAEEELPVQGQVEQCRQKASSLGAHVVQTYIDDGISGRLERRPAFQDAIAYCEAFGVDYFVTWSSSRFARHKVHAGMYKDRLKRAGVSLVYVSMEVDSSTTEGWMLDSMLELFDDYYSRQVATDTKRSMLKNARDGYWNGGCTPYGFRSEPASDNQKRKRLAVNDDEALLVRRIFEMRAETGQGARSIAQYLNDSGHTNRGRRWTKSAIAALLRNETVIGCTVFGRKDRESGRRKPREQWIVVESHAPIIDRDLWDRVQNMMDHDAANTDTGSPHSRFLFTGLLKCGVCGASMLIESAKGRNQRYWYYNCRAAREEKVHKPRRINAHELDDWLVDVIADKVFTRGELTNLLKEMHAAASSWAKERQKRLQAAAIQLAAVETRNNKIFEMFEQFGKDTPNLADLTRRLRANNAQIAELERDIKTIETEQPPELNITEDQLDDMAEFLVAVIKESDNPKKIRSFFSGFIDSVEVDVTEVRINYKPELLFSAGVPSTIVWLPETDSLRTKTIQVQLPRRLQRAA